MNYSQVLGFPLRLLFICRGVTVLRIIFSLSDGPLCEVTDPAEFSKVIQSADNLAALLGIQVMESYLQQGQPIETSVWSARVRVE